MFRSSLLPSLPHFLTPHTTSQFFCFSFFGGVAYFCALSLLQSLIMQKSRDFFFQQRLHLMWFHSVWVSHWVCTSFECASSKLRFIFIYLDPVLKTYKGSFKLVEIKMWVTERRRCTSDSIKSIFCIFSVVICKLLIHIKNTNFWIPIEIT